MKLYNGFYKILFLEVVVFYNKYEHRSVDDPELF